MPPLDGLFHEAREITGNYFLTDEDDSMIYVSGSVAFDRIMTFKGKFKDSIIADKLDHLNVCFVIDTMVARRGGCAGNIAYTLSLLGEKPIVISEGGCDFAGYREHMKSLGLSLEGIHEDATLYTATCSLTTDQSGNQLINFYPGATVNPSGYTFPNLKADDLAIVSPGNLDEMLAFPKLYREKGVRFIFDPGQQLPLFSKDMLESCMQGSFGYICNEYELSLTCQTMGMTEEELVSRTQWLITTLAERGVRVRNNAGVDETIPAAPCRAVADPTGAGDSERSGLLLGLARGLSVPEAARLGAVSASYCIECQGTQEHSFTKDEFAARYESAFGRMPVTL